MDSAGRRGRVSRGAAPDCHRVQRPPLRRLDALVERERASSRMVSHERRTPRAKIRLSSDSPRIRGARDGAIRGPLDRVWRATRRGGVAKEESRAPSPRS